MNLKDCLFIINKKLLNSKNRLLILVTFFIFIILFCVIIFYEYTNYSLNYNTNSNNQKTILVSITKPNDPNINKIEQINHVVYSVLEYLNTQEFVVPDFNTENNIGYLLLTPLIDENEINIKNGNKIIGPNEAICPNKFYPYILEDYFIKEDFLKGKDAIGKNFTINNTAFTIVGTYDNSEAFATLNTCYVSKETFEKISANNSNNLIVRVSDSKYVTYVAKEIKNLGFDVTTNLNTFYSKNSKTIAIFITIITILISCNIIYNFIKKKIIYNLKNYGILKSCGYKNKTIFKIDLIENFLLITISFILSFIIFIIIYTILLNNLKILDAELYMGSMSYNIPILDFLATYLLIMIITFLAGKILLKIYLKTNINYLLRGE